MPHARAIRMEDSVKSTVDARINQRLRSELSEFLANSDLDSAIQACHDMVMARYFSKIIAGFRDKESTVGEQFLAAELEAFLEDSIAEVCENARRALES